jgi:PAS domain-containing protein
MCTAPGVIILNQDREIRLFSPAAEDLLGWRADQVTGLQCSVVLDCRDAQGEPMCERCGLAETLARQEMTSPVRMRMADPFSDHREVSATFWYLPPAGSFFEPRAMAVLRSTEGNEGSS